MRQPPYGASLAVAADEMESWANNTCSKYELDVSYVANWPRIPAACAHVLEEGIGALEPDPFHPEPTRIRMMRRSAGSGGVALPRCVWAGYVYDIAGHLVKSQGMEWRSAIAAGRRCWDLSGAAVHRLAADGHVAGSAGGGDSAEAMVPVEDDGRRSVSSEVPEAPMTVDDLDDLDR